MERNSVWIDLGTRDFKDVLNLQRKLVEMRKKDIIKDTILICEYNPLIYFGSSSRNNDFSKEFMEMIRSIYGKDDEEILLEYLAEKNIEFIRSDGGGGASYLGPGQLIIHPIIDIVPITGKSIGIGEYKNIIDRMMRDVVKEYGVDAQIVEVAKEMGEESDLRKDRRDLWVRKNEMNYKIGGKGIRCSIYKEKCVSHYGFSFYVKPEGIDGFKYVNACGYTKEELGVTSIEDEINEKIDMKEFKSKVVSKIRNHFGYSEIKKIDQENLFP